MTATLLVAILTVCAARALVLPNERDNWRLARLVDRMQR